jgi:type I restriction enzyme R subunit
MKPTDTSEKGLEALIVKHLIGQPTPDVALDNAVQSSAGYYSVGGYQPGQPSDYNRDVALDVVKLLAFLQATQPKIVETLELAQDGIKRSQFLHRIQGEIAKRGVVDVLRKGVSHGPAHVDLYKFLPTPGNASSAENFAKNIFSVTRQLRYSNDETARSLDMAIFINGLPVATFELKNSLTKQTVADAITQYQTDRDPRELLFQMGRCIVHFAVDDSEVAFCTHLTGKTAWFLPFNQGWNSGAGNPPNPDGLKTDYLWKQVLAKESLANIIENFAQIVEEEDERGKKKRKQVFPRFHQLRTVRALLRRCGAEGVGRRYLIQHSAGSGKSNTIAWLAHQLVELKQADDANSAQFDSVIVITDRRALDTQIAKTIKGYDHVASIFGHSDSAEELRGFLRKGKKIIVTTVQKFPFILDELDDLGSRRFALLIDEAHSSQGGKTSAAMSEALGGRAAANAAAAADADDSGPDPEDTVNEALERRMAARKMLTNASYFAFTATPKNKTLEMFGEPLPPDGEGKIKHRPFHSYTMKQAVDEGFILDVLKAYTPVDSYYKLVAKVESDPEFDTKKAKKKLRRYVESHDHAIRLKGEIMIDHFHEQVIAAGKIGGEARAMVICNGIERAIQYFHTFKSYLLERKSPYQAIVAFSGEHEYGGGKVSEASLNGFSSAEIADKIQEDPYRFLICADKFQTGYDEPLLHTMYVDKPLSGVKAVQTLSRLNRAHPKKHDCFVLDFQNNSEGVKKSFQNYYRTTLLAEETDPNKLHDLKAALDSTQVYAPAQVLEVVENFLAGADRDQLDPLLDACVAVYEEQLDEDGQVEFKGKAKAFCRTYAFLSSVIAYSNAEWEKLSIFLDLLTPKLPAPKEEDLANGILEAIDMDSYRAEKKAAMTMALADEDAEIDPVPTDAGGRNPEPELDRLSNILQAFNDQYGTLFDDGDRVLRRIREDIAPKVAADDAFQNAKANTPHTARMAHDAALGRVMQVLLKDDTQVYKQFVENESFRRAVSDMVYTIANQRT